MVGNYYYVYGIYLQYVLLVYVQCIVNWVSRASPPSRTAGKYMVLSIPYIFDITSLGTCRQYSAYDYVGSLGLPTMH